MTGCPRIGILANSCAISPLKSIPDFLNFAFSDSLFDLCPGCREIRMNAAEMKTKDTAVRIIREKLTEMRIEIKQIFLFGSRARGDARPDSDWDFLVIVDRDMPRAEKRELIVNILRKMAEFFIDAEIIIKSETQFAADRDDKGKVTYYALHEGVLV